MVAMKSNPGEKPPAKKIMAAATGEKPKSPTLITRTKPASPAMPGTRFHRRDVPQWPPKPLKPSGQTTDEIDDTPKE